MRLARPLIAFVVVALEVLGRPGLQAQVSSRVIHFDGVATTLPPTGPCPLTCHSVIFEVWDDPLSIDPTVNRVFAEPQEVGIDATGLIGFDLGGKTLPTPANPAGGLDPVSFSAGSSRYLDVKDASSGLSVLTGERISLKAVAFALSPGPAGPAGPPGVVQSVTAGDASIVVGGAAATPTVGVALNGISNAHVANGALSPAKITGMAATLGPNTFSGIQAIAGASNVLGLGDIGCGAGIGVVAPFGCGNYMFLGQTSGNTFINSSSTGQIHFRHNNVEADQMTILPSGQVGIGTTTPAGARLLVNDAGIGTAVAGISATGSGVYGESPTGYAMYANGNAGQALDKGGFVKAMVLLTWDGLIELCYNSTLTGSAASTPPCGFNAIREAAGQYLITFNFRINLRFLTATNAWAPTQPGTPFNIVSARPIDTQRIRVWTSDQGVYGPCPFYLMVF